MNIDLLLKIAAMLAVVGVALGIVVFLIQARLRGTGLEAGNPWKTYIALALIIGAAFMVYAISGKAGGSTSTATAQGK